MDQLRIENVSKMIRFLSGNSGYKMEELAQKLGVSLRTAYRYMDTLRTAGYDIYRVKSSIYRMDSLPLAWVGNGNVFPTNTTTRKQTIILLAGNVFARLGPVPDFGDRI